MKTNTEKLLREYNELIRRLEEEYTKAELYGNCPEKDAYLDARKTRYNLIHAPESF